MRSVLVVLFLVVFATAFAVSTSAQTPVWELPHPDGNYWFTYDMDANGSPELSYFNNGILEVYQPGSVTPYFTYSTGAGELFNFYGSWDFDGDGQQEILLSVAIPGDSGMQTGIELVEYPSGDLDATLYPPSDGDTNYTTRRDLVADVTGDNIPDVLVHAYSGQFSTNGLWARYYAFTATTGVPETPAAVPNLLQVAPNPISRSTASITYSLASAGNVDLAVYDVAGRLVGQISGEFQKAGWHEANYTPQTAGVYFIRLVQEGRLLASNKLVFLQ